LKFNSDPLVIRLIGLHGTHGAKTGIAATLRERQKG
jgi:hypothetical protein